LAQVDNQAMLFDEVGLDFKITELLQFYLDAFPAGACTGQQYVVWGAEAISLPVLRSIKSIWLRCIKKADGAEYTTFT
jgi:hypothetical protein